MTTNSSPSQADKWIDDSLIAYTDALLEGREAEAAVVKPGLELAETVDVLYRVLRPVSPPTPFAQQLWEQAAAEFRRATLRARLAAALKPVLSLLEQWLSGLRSLSSPARRHRWAPALAVLVLVLLGVTGLLLFPSPAISDLAATAVGRTILSALPLLIGGLIVAGLIWLWLRRKP